jgi:hypothetical protein
MINLFLDLPWGKQNKGRLGMKQFAVGVDSHNEDNVDLNSKT